MGRTQNSNRKKRRSGLAVIVMVVLLLLTGTYAWFHMIEALNAFESDHKHVVLHDDYDKEQADQDGYDNPWECNKDVYVENSGSEPLFIRIRLYEYMEYDDVILVDTGAKKDDYTTWTMHEYNAADPADCGEDFHDYFTWKMGGAVLEYTPAASSQKNAVADRYDGGTDHLVKGDTNNRDTLVGDLMYMSEYSKLSDSDKLAYTGWVLDEADGWAYWSQKLTGRQATGRLLDSVTLKQAFSKPYYYGIYVAMEAVDETDVVAMISGTVPAEALTETDKAIGALDEASEAARYMLKLLSDQYHLVTDEMKANDHIVDSKDYADDDGFMNEENWQEYQKALAEAQGTLIGLRIEGSLVKTEYSYGEELDMTGISVFASYVMEEEQELAAEDLDIDAIMPDEHEESAATISDYDVTISYTTDDLDNPQTAAVTVGVTVTNPVMGVTVKKENLERKSFGIQEEFRITDEAVIGIYKSGYQDAVVNSGSPYDTYEYEVTGYDGSSTGDKFTAVGTKETVTVTYADFETTYEIEIFETALGAVLNDAELFDVVTLPIHNYKYVTTQSNKAVTYADGRPSSTISWTAGNTVAEELNWIVIGKNDDGTVELITEEMVTGCAFNAVNTYHWETSPIRTYLRNDFKEMLPTEVTDAIAEVEKETLERYQNTTYITTTETIYLLSEEEVDEIWPAAATQGRTCITYGTSSDCYAKDGTKMSGLANSCWYLRSPRYINSTVTAGVVYSVNGNHETNGSYAKNIEGVRPAMTLEIR